MKLLTSQIYSVLKPKSTKLTLRISEICIGYKYYNIYNILTLFCKIHIDYTHLYWNQERNQNMCDKPASCKVLQRYRKNWLPRAKTALISQNSILLSSSKYDHIIIKEIKNTAHSYSPVSEVLWLCSVYTLHGISIASLILFS